MFELDITNQPVLDALHDLRENQNEDTEAAYTQALLEAHFIAPVSFTEPLQEQADGSIVLPEGAEVRFVTLRDEDDNMVFPVFTDMEKYNTDGEWQAEEPVYPYPMSIEQYLPMVFDEEVPNMGGLVLNPFSEDGMPITKDNMGYLANVLEALQEDGGVPVIPADEIAPGALQYDLVNFADDHGDIINALYLLWLGQEDGGNYLIVVDGPDRDAVMALGPDLEKLFTDDAGSEGPDFNMMMSEDFGDGLSEFKPVFDHTV
ncbi:hypothetical protein JOC36_001254 [Weissella uvarum]|uniref:SseB family protein n=1 Tax=Weissella uvarum TaxID=1479233 RepID=UPI001960A289|nr:SseB family protein [Weissella uvarum]MBM7617692.1 hypothetical protein [Weissella uvarum]MCM0596041.1 SseB family protein [Weissella uvarum]